MGRKTREYEPYIIEKITRGDGRVEYHYWHSLYGNPFGSPDLITTSLKRALRWKARDMKVDGADVVVKTEIVP